MGGATVGEGEWARRSWKTGERAELQCGEEKLGQGQTGKEWSAGSEGTSAGS